MKVVVTGGAGMLGRKLGLELLEQGSLTAADGAASEIERVVLFDAVPQPAPLPDDPRLESVTGDIGDAGQVAALIDGSVDSVFHFAAVVSAGAEADFDLGYRVNLDGTRHVLEACRAGGHRPRLVFTSSIAVYGGEDVIDDRTPLTPQTSYGAQKAAGELLLNDYTRKGYLDGRALRLPTIVVRPGKPNLAASTFASSIIRDPLSGQTAICPVKAESHMPILSPRRIVAAFLHAHEMDGDALGHNRAVLLGGISPSVGEMVDALGRVAGGTVAARVDWQPDAMIQRIVDGWPQGIEAARAATLGFDHDATMDEVIQAFIDDELGGRIAA